LAHRLLPSSTRCFQPALLIRKFFVAREEFVMAEQEKADSLRQAQGKLSLSLGMTPTL